MQLLGTWLVAFQAIRLDGGRCFKGVHLSPLGFAACQSKKCTNKTRGSSILLSWCSYCLDGALLALASGKAERRQVHPLKKALRNRNKKAAGHAVMSSGLYIII